MEDCMISIVCIAFNHERYIKQTLDGFLMQKTSFQYEILINDDASTDRTAEIIKGYEKKFPDKIRAFYQKENLYSQGVRLSNYLLAYARGKYVAFCEGDDFWVNEEKLQKQVEFMEKNKDCSLTIHAGYNAYENGVLEKSLFQYRDSDGYVSVEELISSWVAPTASIVYRTSARKELDIPFIGDIKLGDYPLLIYLGLNGLVYFFSEPMCVYRRGSVSSISSAYANNGSNKIRHNEQMIKLLERIDNYTMKKYEETIADAKEKRFFSILQMKKDYKQIQKSPIYRRMSEISKMKLFIEIKCPIFEVLRAIKNTVSSRINYIRDRKATLSYKLPNTIILDDIKMRK